MFLQSLRNVLALFNLTTAPPTDPNRGQFYCVNNVPYFKAPDGTVYQVGTGQEAGAVSQDLGDVSGSVAIDLDNGRLIEANVTGNITGLTISNANERDEFTIVFTQGSGGPYTFADGLTTKTNGDAIDPGASVGDRFVLVYDTINTGTDWNRYQAGGAALT